MSAYRFGGSTGPAPGLVRRQERRRLLGGATASYVPYDSVAAATPASMISIAVRNGRALSVSQLFLAGLFLATGLHHHAAPKPAAPDTGPALRHGHTWQGTAVLMLGVAAATVLWVLLSGGAQHLQTSSAPARRHAMTAFAGRTGLRQGEQQLQCRPPLSGLEPRQRALPDAGAARDAVRVIRRCVRSGWTRLVHPAPAIVGAEHDRRS
jgi:hypothetical protein